MKTDSSKKLFIFLGVLLLLVIAGPYFGIHLLGEPVIPEHRPHVIERRMPAFPEEDETIPVDTVEEGAIDGQDQ